MTSEETSAGEEMHSAPSKAVPEAALVFGAPVKMAAAVCRVPQACFVLIRPSTFRFIFRIGTNQKINWLTGKLPAGADMYAPLPGSGRDGFPWLFLAHTYNSGNVFNCRVRVGARDCQPLPCLTPQYQRGGQTLPLPESAGLLCGGLLSKLPVRFETGMRSLYEAGSSLSCE
jgi:hypothetical protein